LRNASLELQAPDTNRQPPQELNVQISTFDF
jgi:hypothetical protein